ncbi:MAG: inositol phosphorylceramide synthase [Thermomicrobiales bacterium]|nr:MAG: inositol phosphorylceramide synthase [Thermomicrobiales bacterium]
MGGDQVTARIDSDLIPLLSRRNDRLLTVALIGYAVLVVAIMFDRGIALTPDVLAVAFGLSAVLLGRGRLFLRDWIPFIALLLAYELMRGIADDTGLTVHVEDLVLADRIISFGAIPTQVLQEALRPDTGTDPFAILATVVYMLHFALPFVTGYVLWVWRRPQFYDFVAGLIVLSLAGFVTYLLIPAAPPWYAADAGALAGPDGAPVIEYLKPAAFEELAKALGFDGRYLYSLAWSASPNLVAAFPSLHVAYPFLAFLALRRAFGRVGWLAFGYTVLVSFSVLYTGDHWLIDVVAGIAYAYVAFYLIVDSPAWLRVRTDRLWSAVTARLPRPGGSG